MSGDGEGSLLVPRDWEGDTNLHISTETALIQVK